MFSKGSRFLQKKDEGCDPLVRWGRLGKGVIIKMGYTRETLPRMDIRVYNSFFRVHDFCIKPVDGFCGRTPWPVLDILAAQLVKAQQIESRLFEGLPSCGVR